MAPSSKEAQRAELHKTIWRIANDLRGSVDGWDFKSYVLGILFYRFISENLTTYINEGERKAGDAGFITYCVRFPLYVSVTRLPLQSCAYVDSSLVYRASPGCVRFGSM